MRQSFINSLPEQYRQRAAQEYDAYMKEHNKPATDYAKYVLKKAAPWTLMLAGTTALLRRGLYETPNQRRTSAAMLGLAATTPILLNAVTNTAHTKQYAAAMHDKATQHTIQKLKSSRRKKQASAPGSVPASTTTPQPAPPKPQKQSADGGSLFDAPDSPQTDTQGSPSGIDNPKPGNWRQFMSLHLLTPGMKSSFLRAGLGLVAAGLAAKLFGGSGRTALVAGGLGAAAAFGAPYLSPDWRKANNAMRQAAARTSESGDTMRKIMQHMMLAKLRGQQVPTGIRDWLSKMYSGYGHIGNGEASTADGNIRFRWI